MEDLKMKNVTPKAGQIWECVKETICTYIGCQRKIETICGDNVGFVGSLSSRRLRENYKFVPQSDLEWLAVNVNGVDVRAFYAKDTSSRDGYKVNGKDLILNYGGKLVQSKRIELGLDEPQQKETKMIDLSTAKVGDKFTTCTSVVTLVIKGTHHHCLEYPDGSLMLSNDSGLTVDSGSKLMSKHDPRHWLSQLPNADLFIDDSWFACGTDGAWFVYSEDEPEEESGLWTNDGHYVQMGTSMPKLTGDEWKISKISIPDLKAWQEQSK